MSSVPRLRLLGALQFEPVGAAPLPLAWQRPVALLALLACADDWLPREQLATRLRPDADAATSRAYLRRLLHRLRELHPQAAAAVAVEPARLRWTGACDVQEFRAAVAAGRWDEALALHGAGLLAGAAPLGDEALDDWLEDTRLDLRRRARAALGAAIAQALERGDGRATALMQRLVDEDPLDEDGIQLVLAHAADEAQQRIALAAYDALARRLALEMALKPLPATEALAAALRERRARALQAAGPDDAPRADPPAARAAAPGAPPSPAPRRVAAAPGRLFGRERERAALLALLARDDVRVLTLRGPGGIGKTRLARDLAATPAAAQRDGAVWVPLAGVETAAALHDALAGALDLPSGGAPVAAQLAEVLADSALLVVLDNFEQLVPQPAALQALATLAEAAPGVRWLVTSRESLGLAGEQVFELAGLPSGGPDAPALALLAEHAARHGCPLRPEDDEAAARIAATLQGLPLALELAAAWLPVMPPAEVAAEVERDLGFLAHDRAAWAPPHRSLRAVFDSSWQRLAQPLRDALAGLSVLHGAFDGAAAQDIARCDAAQLLQLAGKSLLQREGGERGLRLRLHPLVRQFAAEAAFADDPPRRERLRLRHARHFLLQRVAAPPRLQPGDGDPARVAELLEWLPDIAAAWRHAVDARRLDWLAQALPNLDGLLALGGRLEEAAELAALAAGALPETDPLRVQLDAWRVASLVTLGRNDEAAALTERLLARPGLPAAPRCTLLSARTRLALERGDFAAAAQHAEAALRAAEEAGLPVATMRCLHNVGAVAHTRGDTTASRAAFTRMLTLTEQHGAELQRARALRGLAVLAQGDGDAARALRLLDEAQRQFAALGDRAELAQIERSRSFMLRDLGRHAEQRAAAEASVAAAQALGWPHQLAPNLFALALAQDDVRDAAAAAATYRRCLRLARRHAMTPLVLRCVFGLAALEAAAGTLARGDALALLLWTRAHPALRRGDVEEVDARLAALAPTPAEQAGAQAVASSLTLDAVLLRLPA